MTCKDADARAGGTGRGGVARFSLPGPGELFLAFLAVGLSGFGGVLPFARRLLVEQQPCATPLPFTELLGLAPVRPGPTGITPTLPLATQHTLPAGCGAAFARR